MSAIDERTVDPAQPHPSSNMGHEMSDFSWTTVMWLLPISVIALVAFTLVCLYWFRGAKDSHMVRKEAMFSTAELSLHRAKESEYLNEYKYLDKQAGRVRIPIRRAMELVVRESQGPGRVDGKPAASPAPPPRPLCPIRRRDRSATRKPPREVRPRCRPRTRPRRFPSLPPPAAVPASRTGPATRKPLCEP